MPTLEQIEAALRGHVPRRLPPPAATRDRASVALVLAGPSAGLDLCLIQRTRRAGDPWSGHVALPGGRADPSDRDARAVAERETLEEIGLALGDARHLGALDELPLRREVPTDAVLSPFVYHVGETRPALRPDPGEVADAGWLPLAALWDPERITSVAWTRAGRSLSFPGIRWNDATVWGLTLRVLAAFAEQLGRPLAVSPYRGR